MLFDQCSRIHIGAQLIGSLLKLLFKSNGSGSCCHIRIPPYQLIHLFIIICFSNTSWIFWFLSIRRNKPNTFINGSFDTAALQSTCTRRGAIPQRSAASVVVKYSISYSPKKATTQQLYYIRFGEYFQVFYV